MFEITVDYSFAAGHALRGYKGKCENVHGHNYKVQVTIEANFLEQSIHPEGKCAEGVPESNCR